MNLMTAFGIMFYSILFYGFCDWWLSLKLFIHWGIAGLKSCKTTQLQNFLWSQHSRRKVRWKRSLMVCWQYNIPKALVYLSSEKNCQGVSQPRYFWGQAFISWIFGFSKSGCIPSTSSSNPSYKGGHRPKPTIC